MKQALRFFGALCLALPLIAAAQMPDFKRDEQIAEMKKLAWMVGEWRGMGSMQMGPGHAETSQVYERIESKLDGLAILVEGIGVKKGADGKETKVHHALATISWSPECKCYRFPAHTAQGSFVNAEMRIVGDAVVWGFKTGPMEIRYTIRHTEKGQWNEVGDRSMDGKTWQRFFEMTLDRSK
jgi:hypothetical protein